MRRSSSIWRCHGRDLSLLRKLGLQPLFGLRLGLVADGDERLLHLLLDRQVEFATGVVKFALLAQDVGLGLLGLSELGVVRGQVLLQLRNLPIALRKVSGQGEARFLGLSFDDGGTLRFELLGDFRVDRLTRLRDCFLRSPQSSLAPGDFLLRELLFELLAGLHEQRRSQRFGQLD